MPAAPEDFVEPHVARVPARLVLVSAAALWSCYYALTTLREVRA